MSLKDIALVAVLSYILLLPQTEAIDKPTDLATTEDIFYVNIEIVVFTEEIEKYPETWKNAERALAEWTDKIPVRFTVYKQMPMVPLFPTALNFTDRHGIIEVRLGDLSEPPYNNPDNILGLWEIDEQKILLDADRLENQPELAYSVTMHEFGHLFGLPHIVGFKELGYTGWIVLSEGVDPTNYVMYSHQVQNKPQKTLSSLEIMLAKNNLLHYWTRPDRAFNSSDDCHFVLDNQD